MREMSSNTTVISVSMLLIATSWKRTRGLTGFQSLNDMVRSSCPSSDCSKILIPRSRNEVRSMNIRSSLSCRLIFRTSQQGCPSKSAGPIVLSDFASALIWIASSNQLRLRRRSLASLRSMSSSERSLDPAVVVTSHANSPLLPTSLVPNAPRSSWILINSALRKARSSSPRLSEPSILMVACAVNDWRSQMAIRPPTALMYLETRLRAAAGSPALLDGRG